MRKSKCVDVTTGMLHLLVDEAKETFYQSKQSKERKDILRTIFPIFHLLYRPQGAFRGRAYSMNIKARKEFKCDLSLTKRSHPYTKIGWNNYFMVIEINTYKAKFVDREKLANLVSHE